MFEVVASSIGSAYAGYDKAKALAIYHEQVVLNPGDQVLLFEGASLTHEYEPTLGEKRY